MKIIFKYFVAVFVIMLFCIVLLSFNSKSTSYDINLVIKDFIGVSITPQSWHYFIYNWFGKLDVDLENIDQQTIDEYFLNDFERKNAITAINYLQSYDTYGDENKLKKWDKFPVLVSLSGEEEIDNAVKSIAKIIKENTNIVFKLTNEKNVEGINIYTYGLLNSETDHCVYDKKCGDPISRNFTKYFKGDGVFTALNSILPLQFNQYPVEIRSQYEFITRFTMSARFSNRFRKDYHVHGGIVHDDKYQIKEAMCDIYNNHENINITKSLVSECIIRSLGLTQFSNNKKSFLYRRSIDFTEINWEHKITEYDLLLLNILYNDKLKPGMNKEEINSILEHVELN